MKKRTKRIEVAVTDDEYQQLLVRKTKPRLAEWLRELALDQEPIRTIKPVDPNLLYQLNKISTNLNQIAKHCNTRAVDFDLVRVAIQLQAIEKQLSELTRYDY